MEDKSKCKKCDKLIKVDKEYCMDCAIDIEIAEFEAQLEM